MSDDLFHDNSNPNLQDVQSHNRGGELIPVDDQQNQAFESFPADLRRIEELAQELLELKLVYLADTDQAKREISKLRGSMYWLTVILIGAIAIASGGISWLAFSLRSEQAQLVRQVESVATETVAVERIEQIESQIETLNEQFPNDVIENVQANQDQLQGLESRITEVSSQVNTRRETIAILARALQDLINVEDQEAIAPSNSTSSDPQSDLEAESDQAAPATPNNPTNETQNPDSSN